MLTPKNYGVQYSKNYIRSYLVQEQNVQYQQELTYIQGKNSIFPNAYMYNLYRRLGGYDLYPQMVSVIYLWPKMLYLIFKII